MESYICLSQINDFLYSPKSLYLHSIYKGLNKNVYHEKPQVIGLIKHSSLEDGRYSRSKKFIKGLSVYSEKYNIGGKIDIYDSEKRSLTERKAKINKIYEGHKFQLYGQMLCMEEMGYPVDSLCIYSMTDNKKYHIPKPNKEEIKRFKKTLQKMRYFTPGKNIEDSPKCDLSIYRHLNY